MKMNRIDQTFLELKQTHESALVGFVTAGDPDTATSLDIVLAMCRSGLDVLELGIPFSDPTADGPVIQRSSARALEAGMHVKAVLEMTRRVRAQANVPIILFSYYNPIYVYGAARFYRDAVASGADGLLVVDLPPEESEEMLDLWPDGELALIRLVAPTTPPERMAFIQRAGSGFLYLVSQTGTTGGDGPNLEEIEKNTRALRSVSTLPVCVGFGISTPAAVAAIADMADGVVIGSAFERLIEANMDRPDLPELLGRRVTELKQATRGCRAYADGSR